MKALFVVAAAITLVLGVAWTLFPGPMFASLGVQPDPAAVYFGRRYGGLFFGYAVILWLGRAAGPGAARRAILAGGATACTVMAILSLIGALTGVVNAAMWSAVVIEVLLAAGFAYFYVIADRSAAPEGSAAL